MFQQLNNELKQLKKWRNDTESTVSDKWTKAIRAVIGEEADLFSETVRSVVEPWNKWKKDELDKIEKIYQTNVDILNSEFKKHFEIE